MKLCSGIYTFVQGKNINRMSVVVEIPEVTRDVRIGSVFNYLFKVIKQTENTDKDVIWDFQGRVFLHPFFMAPLSIYKHMSEKNIICKNYSDICKSYFEKVCFENLLFIDKNTDLIKSLQEFEDKSYTPICCFEMCGEHVDSLQTVLQNVIEKQSKMDTKLKTPLSYFLGELICNISQHSQSKYGYVFCQYLKREKSILLCIADRGITIYGSYLNSKKYMDEIGEDEALALKKANEGYSTKDLPNPEDRGYGLSSTKNMLVNGLGGDFFMFSGSAFHRHNRESCDFINLPPNFNWVGTIVLMRIPTEVEKSFNYYNYIQ